MTTRKRIIESLRINEEYKFSFEANNKWRLQGIVYTVQVERKRTFEFTIEETVRLYKVKRIK